VKFLHKYLRAIGFSQVSNRKQMEELIKYVVMNSTDRIFTSHDDEFMYAQYSKDFAPNVGLIVRGEFDEENHFYTDFCFPYIKGTLVSSTEDISVERHAEKESYAGVCDDIKVGVSVIFYLQNVLEYIKMCNEDRIPAKGTSLILSALSVGGMIMMPICKNEKDLAKDKKASVMRRNLLNEARKGNEQAIESLTLDDMDTYSSLSRKILKEDIYTLVDTYFMPYGVECDHYSVMGEIIEYTIVKNELTKEEMYIMTINSNELCYDVCINKKDLLGEPQIGRRFKGIIWMQGIIQFPK